MSIGDDAVYGLGQKRRIAAAAFAALLILSVFWPAPAVNINQLCCHAALTVDDLSFLGREAPSWDVVFWCIAGLFTLFLLLHPPNDHLRDFGEAWSVLRAMRVRVLPLDFGVLALSAVVVALTWIFADARVTAFAERIQSDEVQDTIRITNRLAGGMNPAMIVIFFFLAGVVYRHRRWIDYSVAMALAGAAAGIFVQLLKFVVRRTRPELWLGPFHHLRAGANSFPSGHTVAAFALGGVLILGSPSRTLRMAVLLLAIAVGISRILAFRHWSSDVVASAAVGLLAAMVVGRAVSGVTKSAAPVA